MTDHILATSYRIPLSQMRDHGTGLLTSADGSQTGHQWGFKATVNYEYAQGRETEISVYGFVQFTMPANYIAGSAFSVAATVLASDTIAGAELVGKDVQVSASRLALDGWNGTQGEVIVLATQPISSGDTTVYTFTSAGAADIADLEPGDMIAIFVGCNWAEVTTPTVPILVNILVNLDPA